MKNAIARKNAIRASKNSAVSDACSESATMIRKPRSVGWSERKRLTTPSCKHGLQAQRRRELRRKTTRGDAAVHRARTATARVRRAAQRCRMRNAICPARDSASRAGADRDPPARSAPSARARARVRARSRTGRDGTPRVPRVLRPTSRRGPRMRRGGVSLASRGTYRGGVMVEEGKPAPDFELTSDAGETVKLSDLRGKPVVVYFYPRDDTPGCTAQACAIRDSYDEFAQRGAVVLGISPDSETSHVKFKEKYDLPFTLLADPEHAVADEYGTWVERHNYGKTYMGVERSTFLIDREGRVAKVMRRVKPDTHADQVLEALPD